MDNSANFLTSGSLDPFMEPTKPALAKSGSTSVDAAIEPTKPPKPPKPIKTVQSAPTAKPQPVSADQALGKIGDLGKEQMNAPPSLQLPPRPQQQGVQGDMNAWGIVAIAISALASLRTRQPLTTAMNAAAAAMTAMHDKNQEAMDRAYKEWETNTRIALETQRYELSAYQDLMRGRIAARGQDIQEARLGFLEDKASEDRQLKEKALEENIDVKREKIKSDADYHEQAIKVKTLAVALKDPAMLAELDAGTKEGGPEEGLRRAAKLLEKRQADAQSLRDRSKNITSAKLTQDNLKILEDSKEYKDKVAQGDIMGALEMRAEVMAKSNPAAWERMQKAKVEPDKVNKAADAVGKYNIDPHPYFGGWLGRSEIGKQIREAVLDKYPDFDETNFRAKQSLMTSLASGKYGDRIASLTMLMGHLSVLENLSKALPNDADAKMVNGALIKFAQQFDPNVSSYEAAAKAVKDEFVRVLLGSSGGALADRAESAADFSNTFTKPQLEANIATIKKLVNSRIVADYNRASKFYIDTKKYFPPDVMQYFGVKPAGTDEAGHPQVRNDPNAPQDIKLEGAGGISAPSLDSGGGEAAPVRIPQADAKKQAPAGWSGKQEDTGKLNGKLIFNIKGKWVYGDGKPVE